MNDLFSHVGSIIEVLMKNMLESNDNDAIKAIKITRYGIYTYKEVLVGRKQDICVKGETLLYSDSGGNIPYDKLPSYISTGRTRIKFKRNKTTKLIDYVRVLIYESLTKCMSEEYESETGMGMYLYVRDLYAADTPEGKKYISDLGFIHNDSSTGVSQLDASYYLIERQFGSLDDQITFLLLSRGYYKGVLDTNLANLYGIDSNNCRDYLCSVNNNNTAGFKALTFNTLGVDIRTKITMSADNQALRYYEITDAMESESIKHTNYRHILRENKKGICLVNKTLLSDFLSRVCMFEPNTTDIIDLLTDDDGMISCNNPLVVREYVKRLTDSDKAKSITDSQLLDIALRTPHKLVVLSSMSKVNQTVLNYSEDNLVFIIDNFDNLHDIYLKMQDLNVNKQVFIERLFGILDIKKNIYLKLNRTYKSVLKNGTYIDLMELTNFFIKNNKKYDFLMYLNHIVKNTIFSSIIVNNLGIRLINKETIKSLEVPLTFNNMINFLSTINPTEDILDDLKKNSIVTIPFNIDGKHLKITIFIENNEVMFIIKRLGFCARKLDGVILPKANKLELNTKCFHGKNIRFLIRGNSELNFNDVVGTLLYETLTYQKKVVLIDLDYSIDTSLLPQDKMQYLEVIRDKDAIIDIIDARRPDIVIVHKAKGEIVRRIYEIAPMASNIIVTSKFSTYYDLYLNYIHNQVESEVYKYYTLCYYECTDGTNFERSMIKND